MGARDQNREIIKLELAANVLRSSGELRFVASGASMIPSIFPGDMLIVQHEPMAAVRCGDVVLWARDGKFCVHRVVKIGTTGESRGAESLTTRGDALEENDPAIRSDEFLGRVRAIVRWNTRIEITSPRSVVVRALSDIAKRSDFAATWLLRYNSLMCWLTRNQPLFPADPCRESMECE